MVKKEWVIPQNINKPIETVYEIKNEYDVPSFEEFMKDYKVDENFNYDDLSGGGIGEVKGYGPCTTNDYCSCSSYELRRQLKQKQADLDILWEKFKEYDEKWENYKSAVDSFFSEMDESRNIPIRKIMEHPVTKIATDIIPFSSTFTSHYDLAMKLDEESIERRGKETRRSCYNIVCDKYNEIKDWYWQIRSR